MNTNEKRQVETDHEKEIYETKAASSFGVFTLLTIVIIVFVILSIGFFLLNFMNS